MTCSDSGRSTSPTRNRGEAEWERQALDDVVDSIQQQASRLALTVCPGCWTVIVKSLCEKRLWKSCSLYAARLCTGWRVAEGHMSLQQCLHYF